MRKMNKRQCQRSLHTALPGEYSSEKIDGKCIRKGETAEGNCPRKPKARFSRHAFLIEFRMINKAIRELEKETKNLERSAKRLEGDIKKAGRDNQIVRNTLGRF
jgi:hypothetical protein